MELTIKEKTALFCLHKDGNSESIPQRYFDNEVTDSLLSYDLIEKIGNSYQLTAKAADVINDSKFVVVYPLATEKGVVKNYNDVLNTMSPKAARALGTAVLNTDFHKRIGKYNVINLHSKLEESMDFYRGFLSPLSRINEYKRDADKANSKYLSVLKEEVTKIEDFELKEPITFGENAVLMKVSKGTGIVEYEEDSEPVNLNDLSLSNDNLYSIVKQKFSVYAAA